MIVKATLSAAAITIAQPVAVTATLDPNIIIAALIAAIPSTLGVVLIYLQGRKIAKSVDGVVHALVDTATGKAAAEATIAAHDKAEVVDAHKAALAVIESDKDRLAAAAPSAAPIPVAVAEGPGVDKPLIVKPGK